jgi:hypothetical protein
MNDKPLFNEADILFCYTRAEALADGVLIDISPLASEAGFKFPAAITSAAWAAVIEPPADCNEQSIEGRSWDLLNVLRAAARRAGGVSEVRFKVHVRQSQDTAMDVELKACIHPGDAGEAVISIMLPNED